MELISNNPGLQHIMKQIFLDLNHENLKQCQEVCSSWAILLKNPYLWLSICVKNGLSNQDEKQWLKLIQDNSIPEEIFVKHLMEINQDICNKEVHSPFIKACFSNDLPLIRKYLEIIDSKFNIEHFNYGNFSVQKKELLVGAVAPYHPPQFFGPKDHSNMLFNPQNPNDPPIYPCGHCRYVVYDNDQAILCESGCNFWFHRVCIGQNFHNHI